MNTAQREGKGKRRTNTAPTSDKNIRAEQDPRLICSICAREGCASVNCVHEWTFQPLKQVGHGCGIVEGELRVIVHWNSQPTAKYVTEMKYFCLVAVGRATQVNVTATRPAAFCMGVTHLAFATPWCYSA